MAAGMDADTWMALVWVGLHGGSLVAVVGIDVFEHLVFVQGQPLLVVPCQPHPRRLVVLVIGNSEVVGAGLDQLGVGPRGGARGARSVIEHQVVLGLEGLHVRAIVIVRIVLLEVHAGVESHVCHLLVSCPVVLVGVQPVALTLLLLRIHVQGVGPLEAWGRTDDEELLGWGQVWGQLRWVVRGLPGPRGMVVHKQVPGTLKLFRGENSFLLE
mmetsp:Transcript_43547/g.78304  ORF Transcript_43547/g.78304 Transcript_43547/m.78304 type:complete len:213 (+) Transcript_43547:2111-2749(+)